MEPGEKCRQEQGLTRKMILLYCRKNHKAGSLCADCRELEDYSRQRNERCPHIAEKTFCSNCETQCYKPEMRQKIRTVMRFSGPRIILSHPILVIRHVYYSSRRK